MTKEQAIKKIEETHERYLNKDQKNLARTIINSLNEKDDIQGYLDFIMKRTGLGFRFDVAPDIAEGRIAVVNEMIDKRINVSDIVDEDENKLIIGDNFEALKNLLLTHESRIDVIYIDPPYNTEKSKEDGNSSSKEGSASKFIYKDKFGRNGWLNMMRDRLTLAKRLLSDEGVIFVSIDDTEQAYLKVLMDEIFDDENNIENIIWIKGSTRNQANFLNSTKEYILVYKKGGLSKFSKKESNLDNYSHKDEGGRSYQIIEFDRASKDYIKSMDYPIEAPDGTKIYAGKSIDKWNERQKGNNNKRDFRWSLSKVEYEKRLQNKRIKFWKTKSGSWRVGYIKYFDEVKLPYADVIVENGNKGKKEVSAIMGNNVFDYPKPTSLIKKIISFYPKKDFTILDFFAGSGTTGDAVMQLNKEDDGNRKFILVTNNENNIGINTTYERLYRIIEGQTSKDGKKDFPWLKNNSPYKETKLRVFNIKHYNVETSNVSKLEEIKKEAIPNLKKLTLEYKPTNINVYYDLDGLNPYNEKQLKQIYSTDPIKEENESN